MKKLLLAGIVVIAFGVVQAVAADIPKDPLADLPYVPQQYPPLPPPPHIPVFSWTGCYLGLHLGAGIADTLLNGNWVDPAVPSTFGAPTTVTILGGSDNDIGSSGILAGGQVGCDVQVATHWVIGFAADGSGANISGNSGTLTGSVGLVGSPFPAPTTVSTTGTEALKTDFLATLTGRLGYAYGQGLFYMKGGVAWEQSKYSFAGGASTVACNTFNFVTSTCTTFNPSVYTPFNFNANDSRMGWTVGVGTEWMLIGNWSIIGEYDFMYFGTSNVTFTDAIMGSDVFNVKLTINELKLGFNYRFGTPLPP